MEAKFIVIAFVDAINTRDMDGIRSLMAAPSLADDQWLPELPNYRIHVERILCDCTNVVLLGRACNQYESVSAVWVAQLCGQRIVDWQAYFDSTPQCPN